MVPWWERRGKRPQSQRTAARPCGVVIRRHTVSMCTTNQNQKQNQFQVSRLVHIKRRRESHPTCGIYLRLRCRKSHPTCGIYLRLPLHSDWGVSLIFVFLCRSVFTKNNTVPHTQVTRADHTIKACLEGITDRPLARFGAVIPRGDNQSTRGMDLLVVSQLRFLGPVPFHTTSFPGQFPLAQLPLRAS